MTQTIKNNTVPPKKQVLYKFLLLCFVLASYFIYLSVKFDLQTGGITSALTWSFFVLCTPIADAGFLLDFPLRLILGIRMILSEIAVWMLAIFINLISIQYFPEYYETTKLTMLMHAILTNPFPYWSVIFISGTGTFLSIRFGDELMDVIHHKDRKIFHKHAFTHELIIFVFFVLIFIGYYELISSLGIDLEL